MAVYFEKEKKSEAFFSYYFIFCALVRQIFFLTFQGFFIFFFICTSG